MLECKWIKNLLGFAGSRPPFVIFTLCLAIFAAGLFSIGYYVQSADFDQNQSSQWQTFTSHISNKEFCMFGNTSDNVNITNSTTSSLDLVQVYLPVVLRFSPNKLYFGNVQNISHVTTLVKGSELGLKGSMSLLHVNLTFLLSAPWSMSCSSSKCSGTAVGACVTAALPAGVIPRNLPLGLCNGTEVVNMASMTSSTHCGDDCCNQGIAAKGSILKYYQDIPVEGPSEIGLNDWASVNLRLQYSSYFLFVLAITCILYGMIKGKPIKSSKKGSPGQTL